MKSRTSPFRYFIIPLFLFLACAPALYIPTADQAAEAGITLEELQRGRQLYIDNCGSCHMLYLPKQFTAEHWKNEIDSMRTRVSITEREKQLIVDYLLSGR